MVWRNKSIIQLFRFAIVGGVSTLLDFLIYIFLTRLFSFWQSHYLWANALAIILSATVNFIWNKLWTFKNRDQHILWQYFKFWIIVFLGLAIYQVLLAWQVEFLSIYDLLAKIIAAIIVMFIRFIFHRYWIFK